MQRCAALLALLLVPLAALAFDVDALWDFAQPARSEQRFRAAMHGASPNERAILETQIARSYGLRGDFDRARDVLAEVQPVLSRSFAEVNVRYFLELGRTYASAVHPESARTPENLAQARHLYLKAYDLAASAKLDALAIDALHMMAFVDVEPAKQLEWDQRAIAYMEKSNQLRAKRWEGSLRNNAGYARHLMGDYDGALQEFTRSRAASVRDGNDRAVRIADWMIAWTWRAQKRYAEAIVLQRDLERRWAEAGETDPYVFEELELLYRATGDEDQAARYAARRKEAGR